MNVDQDGFKRGVLALRNDYLELIENDDPGEYADDDTILGMDLDGGSIDFPFGQEYEVQKRDAYNFLSKIGAEPDEVIEIALGGDRDGKCLNDSFERGSSY